LSYAGAESFSKTKETASSKDIAPLFVGLLPRRRKIAFTSERPGSDDTTDWEIWRMRATDGANPTNLTDNAAVDFDAEWQPVP